MRFYRMTTTISCKTPEINVYAIFKTITSDTLYFQTEIQVPLK